MLKRTKFPKVAVNEQLVGGTAPSKQSKNFKTRSIIVTGHGNLICLHKWSPCLTDPKQTNNMLNKAWHQNYNSICKVRAFWSFNAAMTVAVTFAWWGLQLFPYGQFNFTLLSGKNHGAASDVAAPAMPLRTLTGWKHSTCLYLFPTCVTSHMLWWVWFPEFWKWKTLADTFSYELRMSRQNDDTRTKQLLERNGPAKPPFKPRCFHTCQVMVVRFYVVCAAPPSSSSFLAGPHLPALDRSEPRRISSASSW